MFANHLLATVEQILPDHVEKLSWTDHFDVCLRLSPVEHLELLGAGIDGDPERGELVASRQRGGECLLTLGRELAADRPNGSKLRVRL
jgi:hypothetical protein